MTLVLPALASLLLAALLETLLKPRPGAFWRRGGA